MLLIQLFTALFYDHWWEGKKREKRKGNGKTSIDGAVGKGNAAALWKQLFLVAAWFYAQQPLIISDYTIKRNGMQRNKQKYDSAYHYINDTIKN